MCIKRTKIKLFDKAFFLNHSPLMIRRFAGLHREIGDRNTGEQPAAPGIGLLLSGVEPQHRHSEMSDWAILFSFAVPLASTTARRSMRAGLIQTQTSILTGTCLATEPQTHSSCHFNCSQKVTKYQPICLF